jgi:hypothetical protein
MSRFSKTRTIEGFTVAEMLTSLALMTIILSTVLVGQSKYSDGVNLSNATDNVSLALFQAQVYGVSVKEASTGSQDFNSPYGVSFNRIDLSTGNSTNQNYIIFTDRVVKNQRYDYTAWWGDCSSGSECLENNLLPGKSYISAFCIVRSNASEICGTANRVDVVFNRPNPDAIIKFYNLGGNPINTANVIGARIQITYPGGPTKSVVVYNTGQISVQ